MTLEGRTDKDTPVGEIMSAPLVVVTPETEIDECMAVMTPALIIIEEIPASPGARDFLDGARLIGVDAASDRDIVCEQLAEYRKWDGSQLFRQT